MSGGEGNIVFKEEARKQFLNEEGKVDWDKVEGKWKDLSQVKVSLANKYFT